MSPPGRYLGHYEAIVEDDQLLRCMMQYLDRVVKPRLTITSWCNAANIMLETDPGAPRTMRLRIIHVFEADFNFFLKLMWGSRLVKRAAKLDSLNDGQHGSVPQRTAFNLIMLSHLIMSSHLTTDLCQILKHNHARFDNDASACSKRIIVELGMLVARRCGMPEHAIEAHADSLQLMQKCSTRWRPLTASQRRLSWYSLFHILEQDKAAAHLQQSGWRLWLFCWYSWWHDSGNNAIPVSWLYPTALSLSLMHVLMTHHMVLQILASQHSTPW